MVTQRRVIRNGTIEGIPVPVPVGRVARRPVHPDPVATRPIQVS
jgi:hypothetical protein